MYCLHLCHNPSTSSLLEKNLRAWSSLHKRQPQRGGRPQTPQRRHFSATHSVTGFRSDVAVGTAVARRPPHKSRRAELPHRALTSDRTQGGLPPACPPRRILQVFQAPIGCPYSARSPINLFCRQDSHWPGAFPPSPPQAAARRLCSGTSSVLRTCQTSRIRALPSCPFRVHGTDLHSRRRPNAGSPGFRSGGLASGERASLRRMCPCVHGVWDPAASTPGLAVATWCGMAFRATECASAHRF